MTKQQALIGIFMMATIAFVLGTGGIRATQDWEFWIIFTCIVIMRFSDTGLVKGGG